MMMRGFGFSVLIVLTGFTYAHASVTALTMPASSANSNTTNATALVNYQAVLTELAGPQYAGSAVQALPNLVTALQAHQLFPIDLAGASILNAPVAVQSVYPPLAVALYRVLTWGTADSDASLVTPSLRYPLDLLFLGAAGNLGQAGGPVANAQFVANASPSDLTAAGPYGADQSGAYLTLKAFIAPTDPAVTATFSNLNLSWDESSGILNKRTLTTTAQAASDTPANADQAFCQALVSLYNGAQNSAAQATVPLDQVWLGAVCTQDNQCCGTNFCNFSLAQAAWPAGAELPSSPISYGLCDQCQTDQNSGTGQPTCTASSCCPGYSCNGSGACVSSDIPMNGDCSAKGSVCATGLVCDSTTNKCAVAAGGDCSAVGSVCVSGLNLICDSNSSSSTYQKCVVPGQTATTLGGSCQTSDGTILPCEDHQYCTAVARTCSTCSTYADGCQTTADCCQDLPLIKHTPGNLTNAILTCLGATSNNDGVCALCLPAGTACAVAVGESCCYANNGSANQHNCVAQNQTDAHNGTGICNLAVPVGGACYTYTDCMTGLECRPDSSASTGNSCQDTQAIALGGTGCVAPSATVTPTLAQLCALGTVCGTIGTISNDDNTPTCCLAKETACDENSPLPNQGCCSTTAQPFSCVDSKCQAGDGDGGGLTAGLIGLGAVAVVAGAGAIYYKWEAVKAFFGKVGAWLRDWISQLTERNAAQTDANKAALTGQASQNRGQSLTKDGITVAMAESAANITRRERVRVALQKAASAAAAAGESELSIRDIIHPLRDQAGEITAYLVESPSGLNIAVNQAQEPELFTELQGMYERGTTTVTELQTPQALTSSSSGVVDEQSAAPELVDAVTATLPPSPPKLELLPTGINPAGASVQTAEISAQTAADNRALVVQAAIEYVAELRTQSGLAPAASVEELLEGPGGDVLQTVVGTALAAAARARGQDFAPKPTGDEATDAANEATAATTLAENVRNVVSTSGQTGPKLLAATATLAKDGSARLTTLPNQTSRNLDPQYTTLPTIASGQLQNLTAQALRDHCFVMGLGLLEDATVTTILTKAASLGVLSSDSYGELLADDDTDSIDAAQALAIAAQTDANAVAGSLDLELFSE